MNLGVSLTRFSSFPSMAALVDFARQAERLGYGYVCIPEHVAFPKEHGRTVGALWWDPIVLATHLASATERIRLIFNVLVLPQHNVIYLAKQLATLDHISGRRILVGVGVGWLQEELNLLGADFHQRGALADEYIRVLKALWTRDPAEFHGRFLSFSDVSFLPKPLQQPHPPILVGGGVKASVLRAATLGDGWIPLSSTFAEFKERLMVLKQKLMETGRSGEGFPVVRALPLHARTTLYEEHSRRSGGGNLGGFAGDVARALDHIRECAALGVTHMTVELPTEDYEQRIAELDRFARAVSRDGIRIDAPSGQRD